MQQILIRTTLSTASYRFKAQLIAVFMLSAALLLSFAADNLRAEELPVGRELPAEFINGLVHLRPELRNGEVLDFYTDTGGGINAISPAIASYHALDQIAVEEGRERAVPVYGFPAFSQSASIPVPDKRWFSGGLLAMPDLEARHGTDGFLGAPFFEGHIWTFDYPAEKLIHHGAPPRAQKNSSAIPLFFKETVDGEKVNGFPRFEAVIAGKRHSFLFDTGAQFRLAPKAAAKLGRAGPARVAGSFISINVFEAWRSTYPTWPVILDADGPQGREMPMIQVPSVRIGDVCTGPVWFSARPAGTFEDWMSNMMDTPIDGALGASAFSKLILTIDYPGERLIVQPGSQKHCRDQELARSD